MGWWGFGITDGDTPADMLGDIQSAFGFASLDEDENGDQLTPEKIVEIVAARRQVLKTVDWKTVIAPTLVDYWSDQGDDELGIFYQCIAWVYLDLEVDVPEDLKALAVDCSEELKQTAICFTDPAERTRLLDQFITALHNNKRDGLESRTLFYSFVATPRTLQD